MVPKITTHPQVDQSAIKYDPKKARIIGVGSIPAGIVITTIQAVEPEANIRRKRTHPTSIRQRYP